MPEVADIKHVDPVQPGDILTASEILQRRAEWEAELQNAFRVSNPAYVIADRSTGFLHYNGIPPGNVVTIEQIKTPD